MPDSGTQPTGTDIDAALRQYFGSEAANAEAIIARESGFDPNAINNTSRPDLPDYKPPAPGNLPEYSMGLFQINTEAWPDVAKWFDLTDPIQNIQAAAYIFSKQGWQPWGGSIPGVASGSGGGGSSGADGGGSSYSDTGSGAGAAAGSSSATAGLTEQPDWVIAGASVPGTGKISTFFSWLSDFLAYFEVNLAQAILRLFLVLIGLALTLIGLVMFMQSLSVTT